MRVILTGVSGFVGRNLKPYLKEKGVAVTPISLRDQGLAKTCINAPHDAFIHLAGKAHDLKKTANEGEYYQVNTELTKQLFDYFIQSAASDFIFISSVKAAADTVAGILTEETKAKPCTAYGKSKLAAEQYILNRKLPEGKRVFVLRPCMIHGPGNKGNLNLLYKVVKKGIPYPLGAFENRRSFLSITNLLFAIESILKDSLIAGGIYNLADDDPLSTTEVIKIIGSATGVKPYIWKTQPGFVRAIAKIGDFLHLPLNSERLMKLTENYVVENIKIKEALNISKFPVSVHEGLFNTIKSFER